MSPMSKMPSVPEGQVIEPSGSPARGGGGLVVACFRAGAAFLALAVRFGAACFFAALLFATGARFAAGLARGFAFACFTLEAMPR